MSNSKLRAVVAGLRMGRHHAEALAGLDQYQLSGLCDLNTELAAELAGSLGNPTVYTDYSTMLGTEKPDVVVIATPNHLHAPMTIDAVQAGVKGIYCEKPMAVNLGDAHRMMEACRQGRAVLAVGHQRRMSRVYKTMRRLIEEGAVGDLCLMRGTCAGDVLSDGTHTIDTLLHLSGDPEVRWVLGQIYRGPSEPSEVLEKNPWAFSGHRYGHAVERGAMATFELENGVRGEILTGEARLPGRAYQDIEVFGTKGRLWRAGDSAGSQLLLCSEKTGGRWEEIPLFQDGGDGDFKDVFGSFAEMVRTGGYHPLCGENSLRGFEVVMAIYESARLNARLELPLRQKRFPLEIMMEEGYV